MTAQTTRKIRLVTTKPKTILVPNFITGFLLRKNARPRIVFETGYKKYKKPHPGHETVSGHGALNVTQRNCLSYRHSGVELKALFCKIPAAGVDNDAALSDIHPLVIISHGTMI